MSDNKQMMIKYQLQYNYTPEIPKKTYNHTHPQSHMCTTHIQYTITHTITHTTHNNTYIQQQHMYSTHIQHTYHTSSIL